MNPSSRIVFAGPMWRQGDVENRRQALKDLGYDVIAIDEGDYINPVGHIFSKLELRTGIGFGIINYNRAILSAALVAKPDIVWINKALYIWPSTLRKIRSLGILLVHYNNDDWLIRSNRSRHFFSTISLFDIHFVTRDENIAEYYAYGARCVKRTEWGFNPHIHRPWLLRDDEKSKYGANIGFIGRWEPEREQLVQRLLQDNIVDIKVWGSLWDNAKKQDLLKGIVQYEWLWGEAYAKALCATKINLGLLTKYNRDQSTTRSFEIPASGAFLLAKRTLEHEGYFREGSEAEFFSSWEELIDKAHYYLLHDSQRQQIADNGLRRCLHSGYSNVERAKKMLSDISEVANGSD